jgi:sugar-specific transcriptional regulator TrmB
MRDKNPLLQDLIDIGFSEREAKVYLVLLQRKNATLSDLSKSSGVRQNRLGEVANNLVRQGYCKEKRLGARRYFEITPPKTSLLTALRDIEFRLEKGRSLAGRLEKLYLNLDDAQEPLEYVETLFGNDNIHLHFCQLVQRAQREILAFVRPPFACYTPDKVAEQVREYFRFVKRGGICRWVYELSALDSEVRIDTVQKVHDGGIQVRIMENLPLKMFVFDRREVLFAKEELITMSGELLMSSIKHPTIAEAFGSLFDFFWHQGLEFEVWHAQKKRVSRKSHPVATMGKTPEPENRRAFR